jgi:hypothetical protein
MIEPRRSFSHERLNAKSTPINAHRDLFAPPYDLNLARQTKQMFGGTNPDEIKISALMELVAEVRATSKDLGNSMKR